MSAVGLHVYDATVFVDCIGPEVDLVAVVAEILGGDAEPNTARGARTEILVAANSDADPGRAAQRPGGFLFFAAVLEVYAAAQSPRRARAAVTTNLLSSLWSRGMAAVAACEYDDLLPAAAGTGDRSLPWPSLSLDSARDAAASRR